MPINSKSNVFQVPKKTYEKNASAENELTERIIVDNDSWKAIKGRNVRDYLHCYVSSLKLLHTTAGIPFSHKQKKKKKKNYQCFLFLFLRGFRRSALPRYEERWRTRAPGFKFGHWSEIRKEPASIRWTLIIFFNVRSHFQCLWIFVGHPFQFFFFLTDRSTHSNLILKSWFQSRNSWGEKIKTKYQKKKTRKKVVNCLLNFLHNLLFKLSLSIGINSAQLSNMSLSRNLKKKKKRKKVNNLWVDPSYFFFPRQRTNTCWNDSDRTSTRCFTHGILKEKENTQ